MPFDDTVPLTIARTSRDNVQVFGEAILTDLNAFVVQRILPPGDHAVDVAVKGEPTTGALSFSRDVNIPDNDWFYVALADLTIGKRTGDDRIEEVRPGEYDDVYTRDGSPSTSRANTC